MDSKFTFPDDIKNTISICNNSIVTFNFSNYIKTNNVTRIEIDWGDSTQDVLHYKFTKGGGTITILKKWDSISHLYNLKNKKDNIQITFTIFYFNKNKKVYQTSANIVYKTTDQVFSNIEVLSANITDKNTTSFVIKDNESGYVYIMNTTDMLHFDTDSSNSEYDYLYNINDEYIKR